MSCFHLLRRRRARALSIAAVIVLGSLALPAVGGALPLPHATKLAGYSAATGIGAYGDTAVWNAYDKASKQFTLTLWRRGEIRPLGLAPTKDRVDASVGRGADGRPVIIYGDCPPGGRCGVYGLDPEQSASRLLAASSRPGVLPHSPSLWRNRVVWVEDHGKPSRDTDTQTHLVYTAPTGGTAALVRRFGRERYVFATALLGQELALDVGSLGRYNEQIAVQRLDGSRRHVVGHQSSGEGSETFIGLSFSGNALYWARVCGEGCSGTAYQYRNGRYAHARIPYSLAGFAVATSGAFWVTDHYDDECDPDHQGGTCDIEHASLTFTPGHNTYDGP